MAATKVQKKSAIDPDTNVIKLRSEWNGHSANMARTSKSPGAYLWKTKGMTLFKYEHRETSETPQLMRGAR